MKPTVVFCLPPKFVDQMFRAQDLERLKQSANVIGPIAPTDDAAARRALADAVVMITGWGTTPLTNSLITAASNLKLIHSAGSVKYMLVDSIHDRGIKIVTAASANAITVAEFTVAMMVSMLKQVPWITAAFARGDRDELLRRTPHIRELADISVGLIGASRVGRQVIRTLRSYINITIKLFDPHLPDAQFAEFGVQKASLDEVCRCEVISVHAPSLPETKHMINVARLALFPDHAVFINTARGALIDESALVAELHRRPIYTLLDVTDPEPPAADSPLRTAPNLLLTPHIAGAMQQARKEMGKLVIDETIRFLNGEPLQHEVTKAMLATQA